MMESIRVNAEDLKHLIKEVSQIKEMLIAEKERKESEEVELTDWAKKELEESRKRSESESISLEDSKKKILSKKLIIL